MDVSLLTKKRITTYVAGNIYEFIRLKMKIYLSLFLLAFTCQSALARTDCPADKIAHIQIEGSKVMYFQSGVWRTLGYLNDVGTKERLSALLAAQMADKKVVVGYSRNDYECNVANYSEKAFMLRTYN